MKKESNGRVVRCLEEYTLGDAEVLVVPIDDEGFIYPKINVVKCIQCYQCLSVCAFKQEKGI